MLHDYDKILIWFSMQLFIVVYLHFICKQYEGANTLEILSLLLIIDMLDAISWEVVNTIYSFMILPTEGHLSYQRITKDPSIKDLKNPSNVQLDQLDKVSNMWITQCHVCSNSCYYKTLPFHMCVFNCVECKSV